MQSYFSGIFAMLKMKEHDQEHDRLYTTSILEPEHEWREETRNKTTKSNAHA